ncbi:hypothetical protein GQ53DRAFT_758629 [Thozetella sp. PMI_491]|nr:hypothetical protein GQ53DRAFT_758629 [Thozetella sp. PMI_491]
MPSSPDTELTLLPAGLYRLVGRDTAGYYTLAYGWLREESIAASRRGDCGRRGGPARNSNLSGSSEQLSCILRSQAHGRQSPARPRDRPKPPPPQGCRPRKLKQRGSAAARSSSNGGKEAPIPTQPCHYKCEGGLRRGTYRFLGLSDSLSTKRQRPKNLIKCNRLAREFPRFYKRARQPPGLKRLVGCRTSGPWAHDPPEWCPNAVFAALSWSRNAEREKWLNADRLRVLGWIGSTRLRRSALKTYQQRQQEE